MMQNRIHDYIGSEQQTKKVNIAHIRVGAANIEPSPQIRNLGAMFEPMFTMKSQVNAMTRAVLHLFHCIVLVT